MHTCPDCGQACYCGGDMEDHDTGEDEGCEHFLSGECDAAEPGLDGLEDEQWPEDKP